MKAVGIISTGLCLLGLSTPSYSQSSDYEALRFGSSVEARVGVTIPFGGAHKAVKSKPQLALGLRSESPRAYHHDWTLGSLSGPQEVREVKLALTMEAKPSVLLNEQVLHFGEDSLAPEGTLNAMDKYDKTILTVIGVSLAVIATSIIVLADG